MRSSSTTSTTSRAPITIEAIGPGGPTPIDGLTDIPIGPGAVITIGLESPDALNTELILKSTNRVFVERSLAATASSRWCRTGPVGFVGAAVRRT